MLFFFRLGDRELASSHEARAGQNAQAILTSGDWTLPRLFDGRVEMQKPPLFYWLVAFLGLLNGGQVDGLCVRLPSALSALGCVLLLQWWGIRRGRPLAGFLAAMMLATCLHFTDLARTGRIDMPLTFTMALTVIGFSEGCRRRERGKSGRVWFLTGYVAIAAGIMFKGPIAVALPLAVGGAWWVVNHVAAGSLAARAFGPRLNERFANAGHFFWGVPLVLILTVPWFVWASLQTDGEFFRVFFVYHNLDRGFGVEEGLRAYPWWFYGPHVLLDMLPWSLLLPLAGWWLWRNRDRDAQFGGVWLLAVLLLLSCMRFKRADYLLPAYPGAAWTLGCVMEKWYQARPSRWLVAGFAAVMTVTGTVWLGYITLVLPAVEETRTHRRFAEEVRKHTAKEVLFFWTEAHVIAFHLGQPMTTSVEWSVLDDWAGRGEASYVVMSPQALEEHREHVKQGVLEVLVWSDQMAPSLGQRPRWLQWVAQLGMDVRERPYALVRTHRLPTTEANSYTNR
ncbi:MAG TPA: phospholipid carrier-dependent glycosyltransferase [Gemmataceae bacterium]|nr:phospholipid carrier-dependent glycosyltransferase [Gemmataceae bacterium]